MTQEELWKVLAARNPAFRRGDDETVTLTIRGLRRLVETSHDVGFQHKGKLHDQLFDKMFRGLGK